MAIARFAPIAAQMTRSATPCARRCICVAPGPVWTPLIQQSFGPEKVSTFGVSSPMERPAQPAELAPAFVFLASDESRFVTGEVLGVTGGVTGGELLA